MTIFHLNDQQMSNNVRVEHQPGFVLFPFFFSGISCHPFWRSVSSKQSFFFRCFLRISFWGGYTAGVLEIGSHKVESPKHLLIDHGCVMKLT